MLELEWTHAARNDLLAIIDYIADDDPEAAQRLHDEIQGKTVTLREHPRLYKPGRVQGTREMVVRPNYIVVYMEGASTLQILRVLHAAQCWPVPQDR